MYSRRQHTEASKRQYVIASLLNDNFNLRYLRINYEDGYIKTARADGEQEAIIGSFNNYKELKRVQQEIIKLAKAYDKYYHYIDDGAQWAQADKNNAFIKYKLFGNQDYVL